MKLKFIKHCAECGKTLTREETLFSDVCNECIEEEPSYTELADVGSDLFEVLNPTNTVKVKRYE